MKFWTVLVVAAFALSCDSPSKPTNPLSPTSTPPVAPTKTIVWELKDPQVPLELKGTRVRVYRSNIETVITMTGGTNIVTLRNRGDMKMFWNQEDRATIEVTRPGLHCFSTPRDREESRSATFEVRFSVEDLSYGTFEGDIPCFKGPERLEFSGSFQETPDTVR